MGFVRGRPRAKEERLFARPSGKFVLAGACETRLVAGQLLRARGSVHAELAEGYGRSTGPDRARFFEDALGSARESREWYLAGGWVVGWHRLGDRLARLDASVAPRLGLVRRSRMGGCRFDGPLPRPQRD